MVSNVTDYYLETKTLPDYNAGLTGMYTIRDVSKSCGISKKGERTYDWRNQERLHKISFTNQEEFDMLRDNGIGLC